MSEFHEYIKGMDDYIDKLNRLSEENPEEAKRIARESLIRTGILDEEGNLKYPYNGEEPRNGDFSRGPKYNPQINEPQTVAELIEELNNKSQNKRRIKN